MLVQDCACNSVSVDGGLGGLGVSAFMETMQLPYMHRCYSYRDQLPWSCHRRSSYWDWLPWSCHRRPSYGHSSYGNQLPLAFLLWGPATKEPSPLKGMGWFVGSQLPCQFTLFPQHGCPMHMSAQGCPFSAAVPI